jgi:D-serine deaminase-like pyridoxal phosphate-dependent protein
MEHLGALVDRTRNTPTPFLAVDADVLARNVARQQAACEAAGVALRPHIKTHKSSAITRMQLQAGAVGVTCATLTEAIALGEAGCPTDVYVSTPVYIDDPKRQLVERALGLHDRLTLTVDSEAIARSVLLGVTPEVSVMVEVDSGLGRTGATPVVAGELASLMGDRFDGFATHGGHGYVPGEAASAGGDERRALSAAVHAFGRSVAVCSAGSTPTAPHAIGSPVTELRPGTYVFGDHQQVLLGACSSRDVAAGVVATVIHVSPGRFVLDAGAKALTKDRMPWIGSYGHVVGLGEAVIDRLNDNHGMVTSSAGVAVGQRVVVVPNHICPVVNLFDEFVLAGDELIVSSIDLRGSLA